MVRNTRNPFFHRLIGKCDPRRICGFCTRVWLAISESHSVDEYKTVQTKNILAGVLMLGFQKITHHMAFKTIGSMIH